MSDATIKYYKSIVQTEVAFSDIYVIYIFFLNLFLFRFVFNRKLYKTRINKPNNVYR